MKKTPLLISLLTLVSLTSCNDEKPSVSLKEGKYTFVSFDSDVVSLKEDSYFETKIIQRTPYTVSLEEKGQWIIYNENNQYAILTWYNCLFSLFNSGEPSQMQIRSDKEIDKNYLKISLEKTLDGDIPQLEITFKNVESSETFGKAIYKLS